MSSGSRYGARAGTWLWHLAKPLGYGPTHETVLRVDPALHDRDARREQALDGSRRCAPLEQRGVGGLVHAEGVVGHVVVEHEPWEKDVREEITCAVVA